MQGQKWFSNPGCRQVEIGRGASLLVALACLVSAYFFGNGETFHLVLVVVVLPLGCIWYGHEIGGFVDMSANEAGDAGNIAGAVIVVVGWGALLALLAAIILFALGRG